MKGNRWRSWESKYEQALVVGLDCHIRGIEEDHEAVYRYYVGCGVGDLYEIAWPAISEYVAKRNRNLESLMVALIEAAEGDKS